MKLPDARLGSVDIDAGPGEEEKLVRYLVYLGAGYVEAERLVALSGGPAEAYAELHRALGAAQGEESVLRFHYSEAARGFAEESRARAAHERTAGAYEALIEKMEAEIAFREERTLRLRDALGR